MRDGQGAVPVTQVLIADQIAHIVEHLEKLADFSDMVQVCGIAREPTEVVDEARTRQPDVVLLGPGIAGADAHELAAQLHEVAPDARILSMLSNGNGSSPDNGVTRVAQSISAPELVAAIRRAAAPHDTVVEPGATAAERSVAELDAIAATRGSAVAPAAAAAPAAPPAPHIDAVDAPPDAAPPAPPPVAAPDPIHEVVPRQPRTPGQVRGEVFVVHSGKGGVGKSVLASNLAVALAVETNSKVALLDLDLQHGDAGVMLHIDAHPDTMEEFITATVDQESLHRVLATGPGGVRVLLAPNTPDKAESISRTTVRSILQELRTRYDHIVVDTPAHLDAVVLDTIQSADALLLVTTFNVTTVKSARSTLRLLRTLGVDSGRILLILNQMRPRMSVARTEIEEVLRFRMLTQLSYDPHVDDAVDTGRPMVLNHPRSPLSRELIDIVRYLVPAVSRPDAPAPVEGSDRPHALALRRFALSRRWLRMNS
ncbi:MAG: P-loop NTPase [Candidatus Dormibacteraeota bacterium]|nr:P-loop NTPase [Candidatus Dormibacteraeota bacterium]